MSKKLLYVGAVIVAIFIVALLASQEKVSWNDLGVAVLALLGTFFGALFAFRLDEGKEAAKEHARRKAALNRAIFVLGAQHNEVRVAKAEMDRYPHPLACTLEMNAWQPVETLHVSQKIDDLDFLLESPDPNMLFELHVEQLRFDQILQVIRMRNRHSIESFQPALEKSRLRELPGVNEEILRRALGDRMYEIAMGYTASMRDHLDKSNESIPALITKLRALAKTIMPEEKFVQFELIEPKPQFDPRVRPL